MQYEQTSSFQQGSTNNFRRILYQFDS